jgi:hypothetical protein
MCENEQKYCFLLNIKDFFVDLFSTIVVTGFYEKPYIAISDKQFLMFWFCLAAQLG